MQITWLSGSKGNILLIAVNLPGSGGHIEVSSKIERRGCVGRGLHGGVKPPEWCRIYAMVVRHSTLLRQTINPINDFS